MKLAIPPSSQYLLPYAVSGLLKVFKKRKVTVSLWIFISVYNTPKYPSLVCSQTELRSSKIIIAVVSSLLVSWSIMDQICYTYVFSQKPSILGFPCEVLKKTLLNVADLSPETHPPSFISPASANPLSIAEMYPGDRESCGEDLPPSNLQSSLRTPCTEGHPTVPCSWSMAGGLRQTHFPSTHSMADFSSDESSEYSGKFFLAL